MVYRASKKERKDYDYLFYHLYGLFMACTSGYEAVLSIYNKPFRTVGEEDIEKLGQDYLEKARETGRGTCPTFPHTLSEVRNEHSDKKAINYHILSFDRCYCGCHYHSDWHHHWLNNIDHRRGAPHMDGYLYFSINSFVPLSR